jgi:hypothetical protein
MTQTPSYYKNSPVSGTQEWSLLWCGVIDTGGDSLSATIRFWTGANGTGSLIAVTSAQVWIWDFTGGASVSTQTGSSVNTLTRTSSLATGGHVIQVSGKFTGAQSVGSIEMFLQYSTSSAYVPSVSSFSPSVGGPGTSIVITGSRFQFSAEGVDFNGTPASFSVDSDSQITATVPAGATTGPIHVTSPAGTGTSPSNFTPSTFRADDGSAWQTANAVWGDNGSGWERCKVWVDNGVSWVQIA